MSKPHGNHNGVLPRPGQPRASLAAALPKTPSAVSAHAKEIMAQLIPIRQGYTPEGVAEEAFRLARAFAAEEARASEDTEGRPAMGGAAAGGVAADLNAADEPTIAAPQNDQPKD